MFGMRCIIASAIVAAIKVQYDSRLHGNLRSVIPYTNWETNPGRRDREEKGVKERRREGKGEKD